MDQAGLPMCSARFHEAGAASIQLRITHSPFAKAFLQAPECRFFEGASLMRQSFARLQSPDASSSYGAVKKAHNSGKGGAPWEQSVHL